MIGSYQNSICDRVSPTSFQLFPLVRRPDCGMVRTMSKAVARIASIRQEANPAPKNKLNISRENLYFFIPNDRS